jgi:hypothetical protein
MSDPSDQERARPAEVGDLTDSGAGNAGLSVPPLLELPANNSGDSQDGTSNPGAPSEVLQRIEVSRRRGRIIAAVLYFIVAVSWLCWIARDDTAITMIKELLPLLRRPNVANSYAAGVLAWAPIIRTVGQVAVALVLFGMARASLRDDSISPKRGVLDALTGAFDALALNALGGLGLVGETAKAHVARVLGKKAVGDP